MVEIIKNGFVNSTRFIWLFIVLYIFLLPFGGSYNIIIVLIALIGIVSVFFEKSIYCKDENIKRFGIVFLCIYIPMLISLVDAVNFHESFRKVLSFSLYYFAGVSIIFYFKGQSQQIKFISVIGIILTIWCLDAIWQSYSGSDILGYPDEKNRLTGIFYPDYRIGLVLAILSPFYFEFIRNNFRKNILVVFLLIPYVYVIVLSGNLNSWFMLAVSLSFYSILLIKIIRLSSIKKGHLLVLIAVVLSSAILMNNINNILSQKKIRFIEKRVGAYTSLLSGDYDNVGKSFQSRIYIWERGLRIASHHWINGVGPRGFRYVTNDKINDHKRHFISEVEKRSTHPHQIMLEIMVETGAIGLIGYLMILILIIKQIWPMGGNDYNQSFPWGLSAFIAIFPINMYKAFYGNFTASLIWILIALSFTQQSADFNRLNNS